MDLRNYPLSFFEKEFKNESDVKVRARLQVLMYLREGYAQREVSQMLRVSTGFVPFWKLRFETEGLVGLYDKKGRGSKPALDEEELSMFGSSIDEGVLMPDGYRRGFKTKDVVEFIKNKFNIDYSNRHCRRILESINCSLQVPRPRNKRRNQNDVDNFKQEFKKNEKVWVIS